MEQLAAEEMDIFRLKKAEQGNLSLTHWMSKYTNVVNTPKSTSVMSPLAGGVITLIKVRLLCKCCIDPPPSCSTNPSSSPETTTWSRSMVSVVTTSIG